MRPSFMQIADYVLDTIYACQKFPCGWQKPNVVEGYFANDEKSQAQSLFFNGLLQKGFQRTYNQMIFPNQTAGLIRSLGNPEEGMDEMHIRFYSDGVIAAELESGRMNFNHWRGNRRPATDILEKILDTEFDQVEPQEKKKISEQFQERDYACLRNKDPSAKTTSEIFYALRETIAKTTVLSGVGISLGVGIGLVEIGMVPEPQIFLVGSPLYYLANKIHP